MDANNIPTHVALIMDGNGRWAKNRGLPRTAGHKEGLTAAKRVVKAASLLGVKYVTLYAFSTENWKRTESEVGYLMGLILHHLRAEFAFYRDNGVRLLHIGDAAGLPVDVQNEIQNAKRDTAHFSGTTCTLAINYGGRDEIIRAIKSLIDSGVKSEEVSEELLSKSMDVPELPDVDLLIRAGGDERISNFLLWHASYAELIFTKTLWPDYNGDEFRAHIEEFQKRNRRFGAV